MNDSAVPVVTVITGGTLLMALVPLCIFFSLEVSDLPIEARGHRVIDLELKRLLFTHEVTVVIAVAIVVTQHAPVVQSANFWIDVPKIVLDDFSGPGLPNFLYEHRSTPRAR
jgi:hypothetical protein